MTTSHFAHEVTAIVRRALPERLAAALTAAPHRAVPLRLDLALECLPSGELPDLHATAALPFVELPGLVFEGAARLSGRPLSSDDLCKATRLGEAAALGGVAVILSERIEGGPSHYTAEDAPLLAALVSAAAECFATAGHGSPLGTLPEAWGRHAASLRAERLASEGRLARHESAPGDDLHGLGDRWAPVIEPALAALRGGGAAVLHEPLASALREACDLFQLGRELTSLNVDLSRGAATLPVRRLCVRAGVGPSRRFDGAVLLLVALATPTLPELAQEGRTRVARLRGALTELGLPTVADVLASLDGPFAAVCALYEGAPAATPTSSAETFTMLPGSQVSRAARAARDFIAAEPDCADAWEVNRWEFFSRPILTAKTFPRGLVLASRVAAGEDCRAEIATLIEDYANGGFNYYVEGSPLPPDVDTIGLLLRLAPSSADPAAARSLLAPAVRRFIANLDDDGEFPTFLSRHAPAKEDRSLFRDTPFDGAFVGQKCATVQAGILLGLVSYASASHADSDRVELPLARLGRAVSRALRRFVELRDLSSTYYATPSACDAVLALCDSLRGEHGRLFSDAERLAEDVAHATATAVSLISARLARGALGPQDVALLHRATRSPAAAHLRDARWIERLLRVQRYDGAWDAEPLYLLPTHGNRIEWHESKLLTTALVYGVVGAEARAQTGACVEEAA